MSDTDTPCRELLDEADRMPEGPARLELLEEAVRRADAHGGEAAGYTIRYGRIIDSCLSNGRGDRLLVAFVWCLGLCDRRPQEFAERELLDWGVTVMLAVRLCSNVPRRQVEAVCEDLLRRYQRCGWPLTWYFRQRAMVAVSLGDPDGARSFWEQGLRHPVGTDADDLTSARMTDMAWCLVTQPGRSGTLNPFSATWPAWI
jgi:hypothetical protein